MTLKTKAFGDIITFTRSTGGGRFNSSGVYEYVGNNVPRLDYDPVTLAPRGLLIEEQRTNLLLQSQNMTSPSWFKGGAVVVTGNAGIAPDGTLTACSFTFGADYQYLHGSVGTVAAGTAYCASVFVKKGAGRFVLRISTADSVQTVKARIDPVAGTITALSGAGGSTNLGTFKLPAGPDYDRYAVVGSFATTSNSASIMLVREFSTDVGGTVWGAQLEVGAFPTSYIPTTTAQVTRAADMASVNELSPWYRTDEGSIVVEMTPSTRVPADRIVLSLQRTSFVNDSIHLRTYNGQLIGAGYFGPTHEAALSYGEVSMGVTTKAGLAYALNDFRGIYTGGTVAVDTSARVPSVNKLCIGQSGAGANSWNGHIRSIKYYPRRLSNTELQEITA